MPVEDHPIHESTRLVAGVQWGCWNKPRQPGYWVPDGKELITSNIAGCGTLVQKAKWVPDVFIKGPCPYDQRANDPRCDGCRK